MDANSPWYKLGEVGGKVVMLGTVLDNNSLIHLPEYIYGQEYPRAVYYNRFFPIKYRDVDGSVQSMDVAIHIYNWRSGEATRFCRYLHDKYGIYRTVSMGSTELICYDARAQYDALCKEMHANVCWYDVRHWK
jgi:aminoglycoside N3'-acetyltransferase